MMDILSSPQSYPGTDDELLPMKKQKLFREDTSSAEDGKNGSVQPWKAGIWEISAANWVSEMNMFPHYSPIGIQIP